jgi:hypothetical protein
MDNLSQLLFASPFRGLFPGSTAKTDIVMAASLLEDVIRTFHSLSAAAWFGALVYRTFFVDPKLMSILGRGAEYERASIHLAHGMRYVVLAALLTCGLTGFAIMGLRWNPSDDWLALMCGKAAIWLLAFAFFAYVSWIYWPKRVFSDASEWTSIRRQGLVISLIMIGFAGLGFVLGQFGQSARSTM